MVNINRKDGYIGADKNFVPTMHKHQLKCLRTAPSFNAGESGIYYIAQYDNGRFCVFTASFIKIDQYHVFNSEQELHEHFEEI
jgi:hypothetical protein